MRSLRSALKYTALASGYTPFAYWSRKDRRSILWMISISLGIHTYFKGLQAGVRSHLTHTRSHHCLPPRSVFQNWLQDLQRSRLDSEHCRQTLISGWERAQRRNNPSTTAVNSLSPSAKAVNSLPSSAKAARSLPSSTSIANYQRSYEHANTKRAETPQVTVYRRYTVTDKVSSR